MSNLQEIRRKISSVQELEALTHAMEMVAQSKIQKIRECMTAARPYGEKIRTVSAHMSHAHPEYRSPYLMVRETPRRVGLLLITTDKGMCGSLNANTLRLAITHIQQWTNEGIPVDVCVLGAKGRNFLRRSGVPIVSGIVGLSDTPHMEQLARPVGVLLDAYRLSKLDAVHICYTRYFNTMSHDPVMEQLLPLKGETLGSPSGYWDYIYEPDARVIVDEMLRRYIEALIYLAVAENMASEQGARIVAMRAATDSAGDAISELKQLYHNTRQAAITEEIIEIVTGAAAIR